MEMKKLATSLAGVTAFAGLMLGAAPAQAATAAPASLATVTSPTQATVAGSYNLHYQWYSAPGYWQTTTFTLQSDGTCTGFAPNCTWTLADSTVTITFPSVRRKSVTYVGTVTSTGLNSSTNYGYMYLGTVSGHAGTWWADKL